jgi:hypothetical protein
MKEHVAICGLSFCGSTVLSYVRALASAGARPDVAWYPSWWAQHYGHEPRIRGRRIGPRSEPR